VRNVLAACEPATRARCASAIAINWHPVEELLDFVATAERILPKSETCGVPEEIGAAGARANTKSILMRTMIYISKPEFLLKRVSASWRQFNDAGEMKLVKLVHRADAVGGDSVGAAELAVTGTGLKSTIFCRILSGWCLEFATAIGIVSPVVHHVECMAREHSRCVWRVRGHGKSDTRLMLWSDS
jgi:hypothetical protein